MLARAEEIDRATRHGDEWNAELTAVIGAAEEVGLSRRLWGPWTCTVIGYDSAKQRVKLSDGWGYTKTFPVSEV